ncbi:AAA domain-containing protein, partial [Patescibacteria group bacterium]
LSEISILKEDISKSAFDGHSKVLRKLNNLKRNFKLRKVRSIISREVRDYIDAELNNDISRSEAVKFIDSLYRYFLHYYQLEDLELNKKEIISKINNILSKYKQRIPEEVFGFVKNRLLKIEISSENINNCLESVYRYYKYYEDSKMLKAIEEDLQNNLEVCGVSDDEFYEVDKLVSDVQISEIEEIKRKILRVQEIKKEMRKVKKGSNFNYISEKLSTNKYNRIERVAGYIQNIINKNIIEKWKQGVTVKRIIMKLAKALGKSKKAFKTFDNLRKDPDNFNAILDLIPVWIMELDDASRIIPLEPYIFDYVILDEASQCNVAYTLPAMYRAKKILFFGDSEQMRDSTIIFKSNKAFDELAHRHQIPEDMQIKSTGSTVQSVLDIAALRGFFDVALRYHYRSPAELIGFSNKHFYAPKGKELIPLNSNYLSYGNSERIMLIHEVKPALKEEPSILGEEISDRINIAEAKAILEFFKELKSDQKYKDKSIGILSFFNKQATYIRKLFEDEGFKEEEDNYKVSIIEGIQGDEKDIIIYSLVIRSPDQKNRYIPLTGEGGDIKGDVNRGRVNVAFSRAKLQTHCFTSLPYSDMPARIWLKKYLEYADKEGKIDFYSSDIKPFDSYFEEEFYNLMKSNLKGGYKIQNQVGSCGFKIDFVISNMDNSKRIAVECDGPTHFKDEIDEEYGVYVDDDEERQRILEAAGWKFYRIKYSDWIEDKFDRKSVVLDIIQSLK